jgi:hypothetical protein
MSALFNLSKLSLSRGVKIHCAPIEEGAKTFTQLWKETEKLMKINPFIPDASFYGEEKYSWVDDRLEEMYCNVEDDEDVVRNKETFFHWTGAVVEAVEPNYEWVDARLEDMHCSVEEDDDEERNRKTFG